LVYKYLSGIHLLKKINFIFSYETHIQYGIQEIKIKMRGNQFLHLGIGFTFKNLHIKFMTFFLLILFCHHWNYLKQFIT
jgi:hypothetical protein